MDRKLQDLRGAREDFVVSDEKLVEHIVHHPLSYPILSAALDSLVYFCDVLFVQALDQQIMIAPGLIQEAKEGKPKPDLKKYLEGQRVILVPLAMIHFVVL